MNNTDRLHVEIRSDHKAEIAKAAQDAGVSLSAFIRMAALEKARSAPAPDK